ncbi:AMP-binding protein [Algoriphagus mannitolivorans]|uniref:AMP-binding protein n=1 Tax=Algoriphagus mannitolivorans TaxID=226504 RepID=UPI00041275FC|nr:AMP-binding protein [Algoriphagus mannitolivorans]
MFQLQFENQIFKSRADFKSNVDHLPPFVQEAINFCTEWMEGKHDFSQQTSGSTGTPKIISITRAQMESSAKATRDFFQINSSDKLLCCLNTGFIAGKMMLVRAMIWNCPIRIVAPSSNPLEELSDEFDFVAMVPLQVESCMLSSQSLYKIRKIKNLIIGGAPISSKLQAEILSNRLNAWQTYGMTETVSHIALAKIERGDLSYQALPNVKIGQDERGALWVSAEMSKNQKIQTNDLVKLNSDHSFQWLGRADFVINSGGIKIFPEILEQRAESSINTIFPGSRFFFFGEKDNKLGEKVVLILEAEKNMEKSNLLLDRLKSILGRYESPKEIYFCPEFSRTENGKINRKSTFERI